MMSTLPISQDDEYISGYLSTGKDKLLLTNIELPVKRLHVMNTVGHEWEE